MAITSTCPGCGATLSVDENQQSVTCPYCGNHFNVNLEETTPALEKAVPPAVEQPLPSRPPTQDDYNPPIPGSSGTSADEMYNPPIPGGPAASAEDVYRPSLQDISEGPGEPPTPPTFTTPVEQPLINRLTSNRLWVAIAIAVTVIFCISCLCMVAITRGLFQ